MVAAPPESGERNMTPRFPFRATVGAAAVTLSSLALPAQIIGSGHPSLDPLHGVFDTIPTHGVFNIPFALAGKGLAGPVDNWRKGRSFRQLVEAGRCCP